MDKILRNLLDIIDINLQRKEKVLSSLQLLDPDSADVCDLLKTLASKSSLHNLKRDPYWPKWDTLWWQMLLLCEMNLAYTIPKEIVQNFIKTVSQHYIDFFPLTESELPPSVDPYRQIICHCALAGAYKITTDYGINIEKKIPWVKEWFLKYQLKDGGLNCDESVYTKEQPHSSFLSTIAAMEAVLYLQNNYTEKQKKFLRMGAEYFLKRKLCRSLSKDKLINLDWLSPKFPRYYNYDILRGLSFVTAWAEKTQSQIAFGDITEVITCIDKSLNVDGIVKSGETKWELEGTLYPKSDEKWKWEKQAQGFALLEKVTKQSLASHYLSYEWYQNVARIRNLYDKGLIKQCRQEYL